MQVKLKSLSNARLSGANASKQRSSLEVNHKVILETFLEDQVEVLYMPEFPAAAISLGITARTLVGSRATSSWTGYGADHLFSLDLDSGGK
jgi:hypothetical protein